MASATNSPNTTSGLSVTENAGAGAPVNTVAPAVTGTATVGQALSASTGTWTGSPTSYTYQWQRNNTNISGATSSNYTLIVADQGNPIRCVVTAINGSGQTTANSNQTSNAISNLSSIAFGSSAGQIPASPTAIFSMIKTGNWSGNCLRIQRSFDNAQQDIGFAGNVVDWAAADAFAAGSALSVVKWYDQSGNTNDLVQSNITATTSTSTPITGAGSTVLNFTSVPAGIISGMVVIDTTSNVIPAGTLVTAVTATTVTMGTHPTESGVLTGDSISFDSTMPTFRRSSHWNGIRGISLDTLTSGASSPYNMLQVSGISVNNQSFDMYGMFSPRNSYTQSLMFSANGGGSADTVNAYSSSDVTQGPLMFASLPGQINQKTGKFSESMMQFVGVSADSGHSYVGVDASVGSGMYTKDAAIASGNITNVVIGGANVNAFGLYGDCYFFAIYPTTATGSMSPARMCLTDAPSNDIAGASYTSGNWSTGATTTLNTNGTTAVSRIFFSRPALKSAWTARAPGATMSSWSGSEVLPENDTMQIVTAINNPLLWHSRYRLARAAILDWIKEPNVHVTIVEVAHGDRTHCLCDLACQNRVTHIRVYARTMAWSKENCINIGISRLPASAKYIGTFDADVHWRVPGWAAQIVHILNLYPVVQPWQTAYDLGPNGVPAF